MTLLTISIGHVHDLDRIVNTEQGGMGFGSEIGAHRIFPHQSKDSG